MRVNQRGEPIEETHLGEFSDLTHDELQSLLFRLLDHLKLMAIRTNATKNGDTQIIIEPEV